MNLKQRLKRLELVALRRIQTLMVGLQRGYYGPPGFEIKGIRDYRLGDKPSQIHWLASRRRGKTQVMDTEPELALRLGLVLDLNPGMFTGALGSKRLTALRAFSVFSLLGTRQGNQTGALIAAEELLHVRLNQGVRHARKCKSLQRLKLQMEHHTI